MEMNRGYPHPRRFWKRGCKALKTKDGSVEKERQKRSRARKGLKGKEIEEVDLMQEFRRGMLLGWGAGETTVRRVLTSDDRTDYLKSDMRITSGCASLGTFK
jgi:hypothetical protein